MYKPSLAFLRSTVLGVYEAVKAHGQQRWRRTGQWGNVKFISYVPMLKMTRSGSTFDVRLLDCPERNCTSLGDRELKHSSRQKTNSHSNLRMDLKTEAHNPTDRLLVKPNQPAWSLLRLRM